MSGVENDKIGTHKETSVTRIEREEKDVQRLVSCFTTGLANNPFVNEDEDNAEGTTLSNILTGVVLPNEIADRLVNTSQIGTTSMHEFINTRLDTNKVCFWDSLKKLKIDTFKVTTRKISLKGTRGKVVTLNADRELFGRLLVVAKTRSINLKEILSYELSCVPVSLVHPDGTMRKTVKSALMPILERNVDSVPRLPVSELRTAVIIDAMALIQMVKSAGAATFGQMAGKYFDIITRILSQDNCTRVDLVFDQYRTMSTKAAERQGRGESLSVLQSSLGPLLSKALPAYHALTGCDTTSAFSGIGKKKSWKVLVNDSEAQQQLASLGEEPLAQASQLQSCEAFVCSLYTTAKKIAKTDEARYSLFCQ